MIESPPSTPGSTWKLPPSYTDDQIVYAARDGRIQPEQLDRMAQGMIDLANKTRAAMSIDGYRFDVDAHNEIARRAAVESMVLLKTMTRSCRSPRMPRSRSSVNSPAPRATRAAARPTSPRPR